MYKDDRKNAKVIKKLMTGVLAFAVAAGSIIGIPRLGARTYADEFVPERTAVVKAPDPRAFAAKSSDEAIYKPQNSNPTGKSNGFILGYEAIRQGTYKTFLLPVDTWSPWIDITEDLKKLPVSAVEGDNTKITFSGIKSAVNNLENSFTAKEKALNPDNKIWLDTGKGLVDWQDGNASSFFRGLCKAVNGVNNGVFISDFSYSMSDYYENTNDMNNITITHIYYINYLAKAEGRKPLYAYSEKGWKAGGKYGSFSAYQKPSTLEWICLDPNMRNKKGDYKWMNPGGYVLPAFVFNGRPVMASAKGMETGPTMKSFSDLKNAAVTVVDSSIKFSDIKMKNAVIRGAKAGETYSIPYDSADAGTYISTVIYDADGSELFYGRLEKANEKGGSAKLVMPELPDPERDYTMAVFAEKANGLIADKCSEPVYFTISHGASVKELQERADELSAKITGYDKKIAEINEQLAAENSLHAKEVDELNESIKTGNAEHAKEVDELNKKREEIEKTLQEVNSQIAAIAGGENISGEEGLSRIAEKIENLKGEVASETKKADDLMVELDREKRRADKAENDYTREKDRADKAESNLERVEKEATDRALKADEKIAALKMELEGLNNRITEISGKLKESEKTITEVNEKFDAVAKENDGLRGENEKLSEETSKKSDIIKEKEAALNELAALKQSLETDKAENAKKIEELDSTRKKIAAELETITRKLSENGGKGSASGSNDVKSDIAGEEGLSYIEKRVDELLKKTQEKTEEANELGKSVENFNKTIDDLRKTLKNAGIEGDDITEAVNKLVEERNKAKDEKIANADNDKEILAIREKYQQEVSKLNETVARLNKELIEERNKNSILRADIAGNNASTGAIKNANEMLAKDNKTLNEGNKTLALKNSELENNNKALKEKNEGLENTNRELAEKNSKLISDNRTLSEKCSNDTDTRDKLTKDNKQLVKENREYRSSLKAVQKQYKLLKQKVGKLDNKNKSFAAENKALRKRLAVAEKKNNIREKKPSVKEVVKYVTVPSSVTYDTAPKENLITGKMATIKDDAVSVAENEAGKSSEKNVSTVSAKTDSKSTEDVISEKETDLDRENPVAETATYYDYDAMPESGNYDEDEYIVKDENTSESAINAGENASPSGIEGKGNYTDENGEVIPVDFEDDTANASEREMSRGVDTVTVFMIILLMLIFVCCVLAIIRLLNGNKNKSNKSGRR